MRLLIGLVDCLIASLVDSLVDWRFFRPGGFSVGAFTQLERGVAVLDVSARSRATDLVLRALVHSFCHLADASSHAIASPILGNILFEATTCVG